MPAPTSQAGQDITVDAFLKQPDLVLHRMMDISEKGFIVDALLQTGYQAESGQVAYTRSESIYLAGDPEEVPEFGEYPVVPPTDLQRLTELARKYGLMTPLSEEAVKYSIFPEVEKALVKLKNTIVRYVDGLFMGRIRDDTGILTHAATAAWLYNTVTVGLDVETARGKIRDVNEGYEADTLVINTTKLPALSANTTIGTAYNGNMADQNPIFTGQVGSLWGLDIMHTPNLVNSDGTPANYALLMQRRMIGGIADENPLAAKSLPFNEWNDTVWLKGRRKVATFLTDPKAVCKITGIT